MRERKSWLMVRWGWWPWFCSRGWFLLELLLLLLVRKQGLLRLAWRFFDLALWLLIAWLLWLLWLLLSLWLLGNGRSSSGNGRLGAFGC